MSAILNRIEKNYRKLRPWSERNRFEAYRLYDRDIPEYPFILDVYRDYLVVYDKSNPLLDQDKAHLQPTLEAALKVLKLPESQLVIKKRVRHEDTEQYEKLSGTGREFAVQEGAFRFRVNLWDYLDTGLFLDHRPSRYKVSKISRDRTVLNLFCYTGSVSVAAALGGGKITSVDLSNTYLEWTQRNFEENKIPQTEHQFVQEDVFEYLRSPVSRARFDLIFLDPPTFSNSKRMKDTLDVQRDHRFLIESCLGRLQPGGLLLFSTNKRKFRLDPGLGSSAQLQETTKSTIPMDFHDQQIHTSFEIRARS
ncbi:MAG: class I SAM-dependent methyltransferase [Bdellovibrionales bacterium]